MGAWGHKNLENDAALDWLAEFKEQPSVQAMKQAFHFVKSKGIFKKEYFVVEGEDIDADDATMALVAAEVVCLARNKPSNEVAEEELPIDKIRTGLSDWAEPAACAVAAILKSSELRDLWEESDDYSKWVEVQEDLLLRLR